MGRCKGQMSKWWAWQPTTNVAAFDRPIIRGMSDTSNYGFPHPVHQGGGKHQSSTESGHARTPTMFWRPGFRLGSSPTRGDKMLAEFARIDMLRGRSEVPGSNLRSRLRTGMKGSDNRNRAQDVHNRCCSDRWSLPHPVTAIPLQQTKTPAPTTTVMVCTKKCTAKGRRLRPVLDVERPQTAGCLPAGARRNQGLRK